MPIHRVINGGGIPAQEPDAQPGVRQRARTSRCSCRPPRSRASAPRSSRSWRPARSGRSRTAQDALCPGFDIDRARSGAGGGVRRMFPLYRKLYFAIGRRDAEPAPIGDVLPALRRMAAEARRVHEHHRPARGPRSCDANLELVRHGLVVHAFGNASAIDRDSGLVVIKPSGVPYERARGGVARRHRSRRPRGRRAVPTVVRPAHASRALQSVPGHRRASSTRIRGSPPSGRRPDARLPCLGTTHADYFRGAVPITDPMTAGEIQSAYEWNTGQVDRAPVRVARSDGDSSGARPRPRAVLLGEVRQVGVGPRRHSRRGGVHGVARDDADRGRRAPLRGAARQALLPEARTGGVLRTVGAQGSGLKAQGSKAQDSRLITHN